MKSFPLPSRPSIISWACVAGLVPGAAFAAAGDPPESVPEVPRSAPGDFIGDCFKTIATPPKGVSLDLPANSDWNVVAQAPLGKDDKELTLAPAKFHGWGVSGWCADAPGAEQRVKASTLLATGANRYGWAYGVLTLPFKYHIHDKSFTPGTLNIGPFLGRRWASAGSAVTLAAAATVGTVRGESRDTAGNITGTPDLAAFSVAVGLMFDVSKNPDLKPFKVGLFYGNDRVTDNTVTTYKHNRAPWLAFQIGFDFTDNK